MPQAHFIQVKDENEKLYLVRADSIQIFEPMEGGYILHTPSGSVNAVGATMATLKEDLQSAQIVLVNLNRSTGAVQPPQPEMKKTDAPVRAAVVRAPPPVAVEGLTDQSEAEAPQEESPAAEEAPSAKVTRKKA